MNRVPASRLRAVGVPFLLAAIVATAAVTNQNYLQLSVLCAFAVFAVAGLRRGAFVRPALCEQALVLFALYAMCSFLWGAVGGRAALINVITEYGGLAAVFLMVYRTSIDERRWRVLGWAYIVGACVNVALVLWSWHTDAFFEMEGRYSAGYVNPNFTAYAMATAVPFALALYWSGARNRLSAASTLAFLGVLGFAIALTGCRGGVIAWLVGLGVALGGLLRSRPRTAFIVAVMVGTAGMLYGAQIVEALPTHLLAGDARNLDDMSSGRFGLWLRAVEIFAQHPWFGGGADSYVSLSNEGIQAHNVFLSVLAEMGVAGVGVFLVSLYSIWRRYFRPTAPSWGKWVGGGLIGAWLVIATTGVWQYALPAWIAFAWLARIPDRKDLHEPEERLTGRRVRFEGARVAS